MRSPGTLSSRPLGRGSCLGWSLTRGYVRSCCGHVPALQNAGASSPLPGRMWRLESSSSPMVATTRSSIATAQRTARPNAAAADTLAVVPNALAAAQSLFAALNRRDVSAVLSLLSEDVSYESLGCSSDPVCGRAAVGRLYLEALMALPEEAVFVLEGPAGEGAEVQGGEEVEGGAAAAVAAPVLQAGVAWHVELNGTVLPLSRGVGVYWADPRDGRLTRILDNPEHPVKATWPWAAWAAAAATATATAAAGAVAGAALSSPLLRGLGPWVTPAVHGVSSFLGSLGPSGPGAVAGSGGAVAGSGGGGGRSGSPAAAAGPSAALAFGLSPQRPPSWTLRSAGGGGGGNVTGGGGGGAVSSSGSTAAARGGGAASSNTSSGASAATAVPRTVTAAAAVGTSASTSVTTRGASSAAAGPAASVTSSSSPTPAPAAAAGVSIQRPHTSTATVTAAAAALPAAAAAAASTTSPGSSGSNREGSPIRMRALPSPENEPLPPGTSFASVNDDVGTSAAAAEQCEVAAPPEPEDAAAAAAASGGSSAASDVGSFASAGSVDVGDASSDASASASATAAAAASAATDASIPFTTSSSMTVDLSGLWEKDAAASQVQEYEAMLDVLELGGLQKVTARLIDGLDVRHDSERFEVGFVTVVPFFRVTEKSRFDGPSNLMRRDLRHGKQTAQAARIPGGVRVDMRWGAPLAGGLMEEYVASEDGGRMAVTSSISIGGRQAAATQVYRRSSRKKSDFLASQRSSYGSLEDVLRSQERKYGQISY